MRSSLLLACLTVILVAGILIVRLQRENLDLRAKLETRKAVDGKAAREQAKRDTELRVLRVQNQDVMRLRNEVRALRPLTNELARLRAQGGGLPVAAVLPSPAEATKPGTNSVDVTVAKEDWAFAGYSNPEAALESVIWAGNQGDLAVFLDSLTPDGKAKLEEQAQKQNKAEEEMIADLKQSFAGLTGFRILEQSTLPDDSVMLRVKLDGAEVVDRFFFKRLGNEWKMSSSKGDQ